MSMKILNALALDKVSGGFTLMQLYSFLKQGGYLAPRAVSFDMFERSAIEFGISKIIETPCVVAWSLTDKDTGNISRFGRRLGIYTIQHFIKGFRTFLGAPNPDRVI